MTESGQVQAIDEGIIRTGDMQCLLVSVAGTVFAAKSVKQGYAPSRKFLALGIVEILACIVGVILAILMLIGGMSV